MRARSTRLSFVASSLIVACSGTNDGTSSTDSSSSSSDSSESRGGGSSTGSTSGGRSSSGSSYPSNNGSSSTWTLSQTASTSETSSSESSSTATSGSSRSQSTGSRTSSSSSSASSSSSLSSSSTTSHSSSASSSSSSSGACSVGPTPTGGTQHCSSNQVGTAGSYSWSIWSSGSGGCITTYGNTGAFQATWNNAGDFLAGSGLANPTGTLSADFAETKSGSAGGYSYIGIYGWSTNPLHEFYITDDWFGGHPNPGGTHVGTITVDGGTYDVYQHTQVNQPSIQGNTTFVQYFSVRQTARPCGHISISEHFSKWASMGLQLGAINSARMLVEAGGGSGSATFSTATMTAQ